MSERANNMQSEYEQAVRFWRREPVRSESDLDARLDNFRILFAYNSGRIENREISLHDTREIFENGKVLNYTGDPRALFEQQNQKMCYEFLKPKICAGEPLTVELILETHAILTAGSYDERRFLERGERPGSFKRHDYITGREEVGSPPERVEQDLRALLAELYDQPEPDGQHSEAPKGGAERTLIRGAYFHAAFEFIHPFADGNGRVGRTLLNYYLMTNEHPPLILYDEDKAEYYAALEAYDRDEDLQPMILLLKSQTAKTWHKSAGRR